MDSTAASASIWQMSERCEEKESPPSLRAPSSELWGASAQTTGHADASLRADWLLLAGDGRFHGGQFCCSPFLTSSANEFVTVLITREPDL